MAISNYENDRLDCLWVFFFEYCTRASQRRARSKNTESKGAEVFAKERKISSMCLHSSRKTLCNESSSVQ